MDKIKTFEETLFYLKHHQVLTSTSKDAFFLKGESIIHKFNSNIVTIKYDDFIDLYKDTDFYIPDSEEETVDLKKDEEYYGRIQRHN